MIYKCASYRGYWLHTHVSNAICGHLLVGERTASLQPCLKPGSTPMMTQPLMGHTNRRCRRFRTNMAIDSFSAALVSLFLRGNAKEWQRARKKDSQGSRGRCKQKKWRGGSEEKGVGMQCKFIINKAHIQYTVHTTVKNTCNSLWGKVEQASYRSPLLHSWWLC